MRCGLQTAPSGLPKAIMDLARRRQDNRNAAAQQRIERAISAASCNAPPPLRRQRRRRQHVFHCLVCVCVFSIPRVLFRSPFGLAASHCCLVFLLLWCALSFSLSSSQSPPLAPAAAAVSHLRRHPTHRFHLERETLRFKLLVLLSLSLAVCLLIFFFKSATSTAKVQIQTGRHTDRKIDKHTHTPDHTRHRKGERERLGNTNTKTYMLLMLDYIISPLNTNINTTIIIVQKSTPYSSILDSRSHQTHWQRCCRQTNIVHVAANIS